MATSVAHRYVRFNTIGILVGAIAAAWAVCAWAELSGNAAQLHHHALYESGRPFWLAALLVLGAWQFMTAAMMLPSSLGLIRLYGVTAGRAPHFPLALTAFLGGYFVVWTAFALAAFSGDMQLHRIADGWPWLAAHATLIPAATLALAAIYQFTRSRMPA
jgi:predicted metal-binding membrane protein